MQGERRAGRPTTEPREGEKATLGIRASASLKRRLNQAADVNGRSLSQEAELRLEQSFDREQAMTEVAYPPEIAALAELLGRVMTETGKSIEGANKYSGNGAKYWVDDPYAFDQAIKGAVRVLELSRPSGTPEPHGMFVSADWPQQLAEEMGKQVADGILEVMRGRHTEPGATALPWTPRVRVKLGSIGVRLAEHPEPDGYFVTRKGDSQ